ncbi:MAG: porin family protein [Bacteroidaceae bacterium]|nr:porin family protein [Bacteroidaceae bacterium]
MKRFFGISILLCLLASAPVYSQFNWGVKAGINLTGKPSSLKDVSRDSKNGFYFGPMVKVLIPVLNIGLEGNLLYSQIENEFYGNSITRRSIEVPVYLRYDFALPILDRILEPFIAVGPQFSWVIGKSDISGVEEVWDEASNTIANSIYEWDYKKSNLSLNLGAGAILLDHIQLHINYNIALGNTGEWKSNVVSEGWGYIKNQKSKTNTWQISAAYIF